jgi:hypothetical protein
MANMNSKVKFQVDKDASVTLRSATAAQITATTSETGITLNNGAAYWNLGITPLQTLAVNILVKTIDRTTGDETYTFTVEVSNLVGGSYTVVGTLAGVTAVGAYTLNFDVDTIKKIASTAAFVRITATLAGTTPILDYDAYLAPIVGA